MDRAARFYMNDCCHTVNKFLRPSAPVSARRSACSVRERLSSVRPGLGLTRAGAPLSRCRSCSIRCVLSPSSMRQGKRRDEDPGRVQRQHAIFSNSLRTRARLPHPGQMKKLQPPPLGKRKCQRPTSRDTPAIVTRTRAIGAFAVTTAIFLILELNRPFSGLLHVPTMSIEATLKALETPLPKS